MNDWSDGLLVRLLLTALFLIVVLPVAILMSWIGITYNYVWGYPMAVLTGLLTMCFLVFLPRFWRGYGLRLWKILFPEYLSPYRPSPTLTNNDRNDDKYA
jgi:hypothetical protein